MQAERPPHLCDLRPRVFAARSNKRFHLLPPIGVDVCATEPARRRCQTAATAALRAASSCARVSRPRRECGGFEVRRRRRQAMSRPSAPSAKRSRETHGRSAIRFSMLRLALPSAGRTPDSARAGGARRLECCHRGKGPIVCTCSLLSTAARSCASRFMSRGRFT